MIGERLPARRPAGAVLATLDRRFAVHAVLWAVASFLAFGLVAAIIPNPVFGRQVPPEPFAIAVWLLSAPLMGILGATYSAPAPASLTPVALTPVSMPLDGEASPGRETAVVTRDGTLLGSLAGLGAFLAIGCPVCNKVALLLLGTSGALTLFAPIQPVIGALSLALLAGTLAWRMRLRARAGGCLV